MELWWLWKIYYRLYRKWSRSYKDKTSIFMRLWQRGYMLIACIECNILLNHFVKDWVFCVFCFYQCLLSFFTSQQCFVFPQFNMIFPHKKKYFSVIIKFRISTKFNYLSIPIAGIYLPVVPSSPHRVGNKILSKISYCI